MFGVQKACCYDTIGVLAHTQFNCMSVVHGDNTTSLSHGRHTHTHTELNQRLKAMIPPPCVSQQPKMRRTWLGVPASMLCTASGLPKGNTASVHTDSTVLVLTADS